MRKYVVCLMLISLIAAGCATTRNVSPEMDDLKVKVNSLQGDLQAKNKEIGSLQDEIRSLKQQLDAANAAKRDAESRLDSALSKLQKKNEGLGSEYIK